MNNLYGNLVKFTWQDLIAFFLTIISLVLDEARHNFRTFFHEVHNIVKFDANTSILTLFEVLVQ